MTVPIGARVARSQSGYVHRARIVQRDGSVMALCGNVIIRPRTHDLVGPDCPTCKDLHG